jgi:hypothetical protein
MLVGLAVNCMILLALTSAYPCDMATTTLPSITEGTWSPIICNAADVLDYQYNVIITNPQAERLSVYFTVAGNCSYTSPTTPGFSYNMQQSVGTAGGTTQATIAVNLIATTWGPPSCVLVYCDNLDFSSCNGVSAKVTFVQLPSATPSTSPSPSRTMTVTPTSTRSPPADNCGTVFTEPAVLSRGEAYYVKCSDPSYIGATQSFGLLRDTGVVSLLAANGSNCLIPADLIVASGGFFKDYSYVNDATDFAISASRTPTCITTPCCTWAVCNASSCSIQQFFHAFNLASTTTPSPTVSPTATLSPTVSPSFNPPSSNAAAKVPVAVIAGVSAGAGIAVIAGAIFLYWYHARVSYGKVGETTQLLAASAP